MNSTPTFALSIRQPWAWLILRPDLKSDLDRATALRWREMKDVENREWDGCPGWRKMRGRIWIHAGVAMTRADYEAAAIFVAGISDLQLPPMRELERGGIVGQTTIVDCVSEHHSPWFCGPWGLVMEHSRPHPFQPCKGALGFFRPALPPSTPSCQWNACGKPATTTDKHGMFFCDQCAQQAAPYTCNLKPL